MSILPRPRPSARAAPLASLEQRTFTVRDAIRYISTHRPQLSFAVVVNGTDRQQLHIPLTTTAALRNLRRLKGRTNAVTMQLVFGVVVVGG